MNKTGKILNRIKTVFSCSLEDQKVKSLLKCCGIIASASYSAIAVCGSVGRAFVYGQYDKLPDDLDFVTDSEESAFDFISTIFVRFSKYLYHSKIYVQHGTDWCPEGTIMHIKIIISLGINICIMVLDKEHKYNFFYTKEGICVQHHLDMKKAGEDMSKRDGKTRQYFDGQEYSLAEEKFLEHEKEDYDAVVDRVEFRSTSKSLSQQK
jgi:hypothetical protein